MRIQATRTRTVRTALAALTAVAGLSLAACSGSDDTVGKVKDSAVSVSSDAKDAKDSTDAKQSPDTKGGADTKGGSDGAAQKSSTGATGSTGKGSGGSDGSEKAPTKTGSGGGKTAGDQACTVGNSKIQASKVTRPVNHLLLTLTNASGSTCYAYGAPYVGFDDEQSTVAIIEESQPQAVVSVPPGGHAYAVVATSGDGAHGRKVSQMRLSMMGRGMNGSVGGSATNPVPGGSLYIDDSHQVSYWQSDVSDALTW